jgi:hypothetical protein
VGQVALEETPASSGNTNGGMERGGSAERRATFFFNLFFSFLWGLVSVHVDGRYDEALERDRELRNVATSIRELSDIFRDLAILVIDQGTALDRIDCNLENTQDNMHEAVVFLEKANDYTKGVKKERVK